MRSTTSGTGIVENAAIINIADEIWGSGYLIKLRVQRRYCTFHVRPVWYMTCSETTCSYPHIAVPFDEQSRRPMNSSEGSRVRRAPESKRGAQYPHSAPGNNNALCIYRQQTPLFMLPSTRDDVAHRRLRAASIKTWRKLPVRFDISYQRHTSTEQLLGCASFRLCARAACSRQRTFPHYRKTRR
ncbi:hypothetical protein AB1N83_008597 [Pleurotus pulmonarius]